jgi:hypothetical protein
VKYRIGGEDKMGEWGKHLRGENVIRVVVGGREVDIIAPRESAREIEINIAEYMRKVPPLSITFRSGKCLRDDTPYFTVSIFERPPISMKPPYNVDYYEFWKPYGILRIEPEARYMIYSKEEIDGYEDDEGDLIITYYRPRVEKVAETAFLFVCITERDGIEIQTRLCNFIVPFDVFRAWLALEKSCTKLSSRAVARRMPAPLRGYLVLHLNEEYQSVDILRTTSLDADDINRPIDSCFVALDSQSFDYLLRTIEHYDATAAFVEILKTAIRHADYELPSISRLLNH